MASQKLREKSSAKTAFEAKDAPGIGAAAHKFKSSSRAIGANSLADLCQALEKAGKAGDWEKVETLYMDLPGCLERVFACIEAL